MTGSDQEASKARVAPELHNSLDAPILLLLCHSGAPKFHRCAHTLTLRVTPELHNSVDVPILLLSVSPRSYTIL